MSKSRELEQMIMHLAANATESAVSEDAVDFANAALMLTKIYGVIYAVEQSEAMSAPPKKNVVRRDDKLKN